MLNRQLIKEQREIIVEQQKTITIMSEKIKFLDARIEELSKINSVLRSIDYNVGDPSPVDRPSRAEYVARVAGFFRDVFEKKIFHLISEQQKQLTNPMNTEKFDTYHKATINALSLLLDWGDEMVSEHVENINNPLGTENVTEN